MTTEPDQTPANPVTGQAAFSGGRFRAWQHAAGVPLTVLGDAVGVTAAHVKACQHGHPVVPTPTQEMITRWAGLLGCAPTDLLSTTPHDPAEYWRAANKAMGPMTREDLSAVAAVLDRAAHAREHTTH